jgi:hypothetical protein
MTEATTAIIAPTVPLTTADNLFSITHQLVDQYRRSIFIFTGTGIFFHE